MRLNVLLDLDGTLTDPRVGFVASINHALVKLRMPSLPERVLTRHIGPPLRETLSSLLGASRKHRLAAALKHYRERYAGGGVFECTVYPHVAEALARLSEGGVRLFLATSKPKVFAERVLTHFSLHEHFEGIYGSELDGMYAEKHVLITHILDRERLDPRATVVVGDRCHDVRAARAHGLSSVGVLWGYGSRQELVEAGATFLVPDPEALVESLLPDPRRVARARMAASPLRVGKAAGNERRAMS
ncbi:phosphoglycolate phosphatase [Povalibacter uvarum]|uniref:Phosphoglycolate phosphatase n=1 Tax=Povalibacter uvarum TaxID=732238 RepID=A0A841HKV1_9GAMM|nr:HAD hydrolase-like protein [Povalibacter uvarum]MBB6093486.1 phosphoglycolate phosphatase [Povalibacter uvarum]